MQRFLWAHSNGTPDEVKQKMLVAASARAPRHAAPCRAVPGEFAENARKILDACDIVAEIGLVRIDFIAMPASASEIFCARKRYTFAISRAGHRDFRPDFIRGECIC